MSLGSWNQVSGVAFRVSILSIDYVSSIDFNWNQVPENSQALTRISRLSRGFPLHHLVADVVG